MLLTRRFNGQNELLDHILASEGLMPHVGGLRQVSTVSVYNEDTPTNYSCSLRAGFRTQKAVPAARGRRPNLAGPAMHQKASPTARRGLGSPSVVWERRETAIGGASASRLLLAARLGHACFRTHPLLIRCRTCRRTKQETSSRRAVSNGRVLRLPVRQRRILTRGSRDSDDPTTLQPHGIARGWLRLCSWVVGCCEAT
jgi:hypothetical protein